MQLIGFLFGVTDWSYVEPTRHEGQIGTATWRTREFGGVRVRMVEYTPGYVADHWCINRLLKTPMDRVACATAPDARRRDAVDAFAHRLGATTPQAGPCRGNPEGARDWRPPALFRLLERGPTLSSSPRLASGPQASCARPMRASQQPVKGHILLCLEGELHTELEDGRKFVLAPGMSYQAVDGAEAHRSSAPGGARLFIVD